MNQLQQKQYTGKGGIYQQLTLPISENILIDEHEPVYVANAQLEELDYRKLYQAYSLRGRKSAAEPRIMFKLLVYSYMCGIYSTRKLELACRKNIDFIWLLQGEKVPDYWWCDEPVLPAMRQILFGLPRCSSRQGWPGRMPVPDGQ